MPQNVSSVALYETQISAAQGSCMDPTQISIKKSNNLQRYPKVAPFYSHDSP